MRCILYVLLPVFFLSCKTTSYFIVRHAERETAAMGGDVPLSAAGKERAQSLRDLLASRHIQHIYTTDYARTRATAQPLADALQLPINKYDPRDTSFIRLLKGLKGNVLVVGHSNTVDDIVNGLTGERTITSDLPDSQYGDLFVVKKKGNHYTFSHAHFGN